MKAIQIQNNANNFYNIKIVNLILHQELKKQIWNDNQNYDIVEKKTTIYKLSTLMETN